MEKKICPLIMISGRDLKCNDSVNCLGELCAWWDDASECCIVHALSCELMEVE